MTLNEGFDHSARSLTRRLIAAFEQDPTRSVEGRRGSVRRMLVMLAATAAVVAGVGLVGTSILHGKSPRTPSASPPIPTVGGLTPPTAPTPTVAAPPKPAPAPENVINNLMMFTPTIGWAQRPSDGAILRTTDGVRRLTVTMPAVGAQQVIAAAFVDAEAARLLTATIPPDSGGLNSATIQAWATNNGGASWVREGTLTAVGVAAELPAGTLDYVGRDDGWFSLSGGAAGSSTMDVFRTQDAGARWTHVVATSFMPSPGQISDIPLACDKNPAVFSDASTGWITAACNGGGAFLYVSRDGGVTWRSQSLGNTSSEYGYVTTPPQFVTPSDGYMIGLPGAASVPTVALFATTDGGRTWSQWRTPDSALGAWDFIVGSDGWLLMHASDTSDHDSSLWLTRDAGRIWTDLGLDTELGGLNLDFLTTQIGWAFPSEVLQPPSGPEVLRTLDGGRTWSAISPTILQG